MQRRDLFRRGKFHGVGDIVANRSARTAGGTMRQLDRRRQAQSTQERRDQVD